MTFRLRRVVTGHDAAGRSIVQDDRLLPETSRAGVWFTGPGPARNQWDDPITSHPKKLEPPRGGTTFRIVESPPLSAMPKLSEAERLKRIHDAFAAMEATHTLVESDHHPGMHRSKTLDYMVLLKGEVTLILDEGEVTLHPGDVVVQRGTSHSWENRGSKPAKWVMIMVDAEPLSLGGHAR